MILSSVPLLLAALTLLFWFVTALRILLGVRSIRYLRDVAPAEAGPALPRVSVIVAARDEAAAIAGAMTALLAQRYPDLEVVAVDDRSTDGTGEILGRLAARDPRLRVIHNATVPTGWLGKNHALHLGAQAATGELILFTDADIVMEPTTLLRAVALLRQRRLDHLAVAPEVRVPGYWATALVGFFLVAFALYAQPWRVRDPRTRAHVGVGAFNLVRADAYRAVGGHSRLPMRPDDDMKLGKVLKTSGFRQDVAFGEGLVEVDWYPGLWALIRGFEKNAFSGVEYSLPAALASVALLLLLNVWPWVALLLTGGLSWLLYVGAVLCSLAVWAGNRGAPSVRLRHFPAYPVAALLFAFMFLRATVLTLRHGGIRWRETHYPLAELRENRV
jgi:cellulose synthase/poly-beta-1,6-N-acetylglucosamine synthase-like glycosyltransferase